MVSLTTTTTRPARRRTVRTFVPPQHGALPALVVGLAEIAASAAVLIAAGLA
jgi:hypothetical protein